MTYEQRPGSNPASPDIDMGLPEVCEKCDRDCPEPCEAFKRFVAIKTYIEDNYLVTTHIGPIIHIKKLLEGRTSGGLEVEE